MSQICEGNDQKSSDTEEIPFEGTCEFTRVWRMQERMHSVDVRMHHIMWNFQRHLSPGRVKLMHQLVDR